MAKGGLSRRGGRARAARGGSGGRAPRGRSWVALVLLGFFLLGAGVIWRRAEGHRQAQELRALEEKRTQLDAQRAQLESEIRDLTSRAKLGPVAEDRLHMHVPNDTELVILRRTPRTP
jgi:cell division protein FtsL